MRACDPPITGAGGEIHRVGLTIRAHIAELEKRMKAAAGDLEFEEAARLRDEIRRLEAKELDLDRPGMSPKAAADGGWGEGAARPQKKAGSAKKQAMSRDAKRVSARLRGKDSG